MFFRKDPKENAILNAFGGEIASIYKKAKRDDPYIIRSLVTALHMTQLYPISTPFFQPLIKQEIENVIKDISSKDSRVVLALFGAGASAYKRWSLVETPIPTRLQRLPHVPPGWRMEALSGFRFWMGSLINQPAPVRGWLTEIYASSAALAWDAAVKFEASFGTPVPALPFALQALAINALTHGLRTEGRQLPYWLELTIPIAIDGYAKGISKDLWQNIVDASAGPILPMYYDYLALYWNEGGNPRLEPLGSDCGFTVMLAATTGLATLMITAADLGKRYAQFADSSWENDLMENEPLVFSGVYSGFI